MRTYGRIILMKNLGFFFIFIVFIVSCSKNIEINHNKLVERKGLVYEVNSQKPFTGTSIENYLSANQNNNEVQLFKKITYKDGYIVNKIIFHPNGQISEIGKYKDGVLDGPQESYFINGQSKHTSNYISGKLDGVYESFFDNGNRETIKNFKSGKLEGKLEEYYENGQIKLKSFYINGLIDGEYTEHYSNGQLKLKHFKTNGQSIGDHTGYYSDGNLKYLKSYNEDHLIMYSKKQNKFNQIEEELNFIDGKKNGIINKSYDTLDQVETIFYKNDNKTKHIVISNNSGITEECYFENSLKKYCKYMSKILQFNYSISYKDGDKQKKTILLNDKFISEIDLTSEVPKGLDIEFNNTIANKSGAIGSWLSRKENIAYGITYTDQSGGGCSGYFDRFGMRINYYDFGGCKEAKVLYSEYFKD